MNDDFVTALSFLQEIKQRFSMLATAECENSWEVRESSDPGVLTKNSLLHPTPLFVVFAYA